MELGEPARRARPVAELAAQRCTRSGTDTEAARGGQPAMLAHLVAEAAGVAMATADDHYTVTAVMLEHDCCGRTHTVLVELLEDHLRTDDNRSTAIAIDELDRQMS